MYDKKLITIICAPNLYNSNVISYCNPFQTCATTTKLLNAATFTSMFIRFLLKQTILSFAIKYNICGCKITQVIKSLNGQYGRRSCMKYPLPSRPSSSTNNFSMYLELPTEQTKLRFNLVIHSQRIGSWNLKQNPLYWLFLVDQEQQHYFFKSANKNEVQMQ